jgi:FtsP/CotA-like multicopper oxidase with cupredoxin domain
LPVAYQGLPSIAAQQDIGHLVEKSRIMKNRLGWPLATLAILTFSLGQSAAAAAQIAPSTAPAVATVKPATAAPTTTPVAAAKPAPAVAAAAPAAAAPTAAAAPAKPTVLAAMNAPTSATDPTKVPHYFGPYSNWANSPQVLSNALVTFTGGGGTGAAATATVNPTTGAVSGYTVMTPGTGYTSPPSVTITSPGVTTAAGATATAAISAGVLTHIAVSQAGYGFTTASVAFTGGGATSPATAQASGGVDNLTIASGGSGYKVMPLVTFSQPDATWCGTVPAPVPACVAPTATATMTAGGVVSAVTVTTPGTGYVTAPTVTITDGAVVNPTAATVTATINVGRIDIVAGGVGYTSAPTVTITDSVAPLDKNASAVATLAAAGAVTAVNVTAGGTGYLTPGLKKFVDTLPGTTPASANNLGNYIPTAVPDTTTYPGSDYYEIAVVQYRQTLATGLPATLLRGYVQLSTTAVPGAHVQLTNANVNPAVAATVITGRFGVDTPRYLGPTIVATKNRPVRVLFRNLLPTGVAGDLFLPVDTTIMGSGMGPKGVTLGAAGVPNDMATDLGTVLDGVRNPMCGETPKPLTCYTENRATLHLHGGVTPWISDGTPNQWTTPAGESTDYPAGVSVSNVPDMPDPGPGAETFFYTNQQSARLMFYHDHTWGITRLNVYAGEAAPYLLTDATDQALIAPTGALAGLGEGTPLVIEDKTFVPKNIITTDPTWESAKWGGEGSLWLPHVYMPAQNPGAASGASAMGRWFYGPWFWPPAKDAKYPPIANPYYSATCNTATATFCEPAQIPSTPNISVGMEAYNDTPLVNGTPYPTTTVDPKAYRYRILNAANDRFWNLQWYVADPSTGTLSEVALNPAELAAAQTDPQVVPTPDLTKSPAGPSWIQIGTDGGFLPAPTVIANQPITWITDPTRFDFGNVDKHALLIAPAERADVIVDFSQFPGKTLILYNDAPAAFPARQANEDFYTGGPDMTSTGGAPPTLPGYGPNTRTIMQVKVSNTTPAVAFDVPNTTADKMGALDAAFGHHLDASGKPAGVFETGSDPIIVGQAAYNTAYGTFFVQTGYCNSVTTPTSKCDGFARIAEQGGDTFKFDTLGANKDGTGAQLGIPLQGKAIHDETNSTNFDDWGRMSASIGLEAPGATPLLQNVVLFPYVNPPTEALDSTGMPSALQVTPITKATDGTQIWKITHNGVDTHPIHWHLYDVQVLNRVTWDNIIIPPDPNELGWKDTVRISPLEDTYVALRPIVPTIPFGVPDSIHAMNPAMPLGAAGSATGPNGTEAGFNNTDAAGNPLAAPIINSIFNYGWEYVWHCHILSHEEMDMMRPVTVQVVRALPAAPVTTVTGKVLNWTDGTPVNYYTPNSWTNPGTAEIGYKIQRATLTKGVPGSYKEIARALANQTSFTDTTQVAGTLYAYRVIAFNAAGDSLVALATPGFTGVTPVRVLDTRIGTGAATAKLGAGQTLTLTVPNLPVGTTSVALNVTVTNPTVASAMTVYPGGQPRPTTSNLNFVAGQTIANMVLVPLGPGNKVTFYNSVGTVNVIADVLGTFALGTGGGFTGQSPARALDTRIGVGAPKAKLGDGASLTLTVPNVPAGATAVALNVTVTNADSPSTLTVYPGGKPLPVASNLNFVAGQTIANMVLVPLGPNNTVTITNSAGNVDVIADVLGTYAPGTGAGFTGSTPVPVRVLDTRIGVGAPKAKLGAGASITLTVPGLPAGTTAVALNVTVTNPTAPSTLTVFPGGMPVPLASNLNYVAGLTIANMVLVPVGPGNTVTFHSSAGTVDVIADLLGYHS